MYWKKLLHFEGAHSRVTSDEFFLSINGRNNAEIELSETIRLLNGDDGFAIACNFPARYQWILSTKKNVPNFDLNRCVALQAFLKLNPRLLKTKFSIINLLARRH
jgi:predicted AlkP superfamily pyrophosphatase or phosphodiesterase